MNVASVDAKSGDLKRGGASLAAMYAYVKPHRLWLATGALLSLATSAGGLALPLVVRALINDLARHRGLTGVIILMAVLVVVVGTLGSIGNYVLRRGAESIVLSARRYLVDRILRLKVRALDTTEPGDLASRVTADATLLRDAIAQSFIGISTGIITVIATLVVMGIVDWELLIVSAGTIALMGILILLVVPRVRSSTEQAQTSVGEIGAALERALGAFRTVKASGAERSVIEQIDVPATAAWRANLRASVWMAVILNSAIVAVQAAFLVVLAVGGAQVSSGSISVGTLIAFVLYISFMTTPLSQAVLGVTSYQVGAAAVARIQGVMGLEIEPVQPPAKSGGGGGAASVAFQDVRFSYRPELDVHHGVSFAVPAGGLTAIVGPSGAGKTTVFSLIERFYEPDSGRVLVDGRDVLEWQLGELRAAIGYVEQDAPVLSGTLRENITFGVSEVADDELAAVLRTARLTDVVQQLPEGLETQVGYRGTRLSGGERQRVAIARALLRQPRLLLLDEVTSQLDAINEAALRETIAEVAEITTVLVVAHRLSTVTLADRIIVMDNGCVQDMGTHAELMAANPLYAELAATQILDRPSAVTG
jgi:ABC-type multidrug transport system fused ATPase/permease subunit